MGSYTPEPDYGRRLLPVTIDEIARDEPEKIWASLPYSDDDLARGYEDITFGTFANAVNTLAWRIEKDFGKGKDFPTVAYLGAPDVRYHIMQMACAKTGYKVLFSSYSNSLTGHLALMDKTDASFLMSASTVKIHDILASRPMKHAIISELDELLYSPPIKTYPYSKSYEEAKNDPYLILHSSGTTGLPKPIVWTHGAMAALDAHCALPEIDEVSGRQRRNICTHPGNGHRMLTPFMHFHGISSIVGLCGSAFGGGVFVPGLRNRLVTREDIFDIIEYSRSTDAFLSPAMLEDLANHPDCERYVSKLGTVLYGGAPIHHGAGVKISKYTNLQSQWGITESGKVIDLETDPEDFDYCSWDIKYSGLEFRKQTDDLYEMIMVKNPDSEPYAVYFRREDVDEWNIGDLWRPHPDLKKAAYTWRFAGRSDDLISYKDGNNFFPVHYELKHSEHELIRTAVISGTGHRQGVLVIELNEPTSDISKQSEILDRIWTESIVPINSVAPANGQIAKSHIVFSTPDKLFERNVKGTVARKATIKKFEQEIEMCYVNYGDKDMFVQSRFEK